MPHNEQVAQPNKGVVLKDRVPSGRIINMPGYQIELVPLQGYEAWNWYANADKPEELIMVTGLSYDQDDNHYSTYAINAKLQKISNSISAKDSALEFAKKNYKWRTTPVSLSNKNNEVCIGDENNQYTTQEDILYVYQAICFNFHKKLAIEFYVSGIKSKAEPGSEFASFTGRLFSTYKSLL